MRTEDHQGQELSTAAPGLPLVTQISIRKALHLGGQGPKAVSVGRAQISVWRPGFGSWQYHYASPGKLLGSLSLGSLVICKMELIIVLHRAIIGRK